MGSSWYLCSYFGQFTALSTYNMQLITSAKSTICIWIHTCMHTHTHTRTHTHTHTHTHALYSCTHTHTHIHTAPTHTHAHSVTLDTKMLKILVSSDEQIPCDLLRVCRAKCSLYIWFVCVCVCACVVCIVLKTRPWKERVGRQGLCGIGAVSTRRYQGPGFALVSFSFMMGAAVTLRRSV